MRNRRGRRTERARIVVVDPVASVSTFKDLRDVASIRAFGAQVQSMDTRKTRLLHPVMSMML